MFATEMAERVAEGAGGANFWPAAEIIGNDVSVSAVGENQKLTALSSYFGEFYVIKNS